MKNLFQATKKNIFIAITLYLISFSVFATSLQKISDQDLANEIGQGLFNLSYISPIDSQNSSSNGNMGFYKLGLETEVALNLNIKKLQLGCGGSKGAGACDIDIDNLSLSGQGGTSNSDRASSDAVLTNPFIQFAIKNPNSASTRQISGFRLSAEKIVGLLTAGTNDGTSNGINSFSGFMQIASSQGTTKTAETNFTNSLTGRVNIGGCLNCPRTFSTSNSTLKLDSLPITFNTDAFTVSGSRLTTATLTANADIPTIYMTENSGNMKAVVAGTTWVTVIPLTNFTISDMRVNLNITGLKTAITINQNLGYVHSIPLNTAGSLSLQSQDILWPGETTAAQKGWWMSFKDPIDLGRLDLSSSYSVNVDSILPNVASYLSQWFYNNPLSVSFIDGVSALFTSKLTSNVGNINLASSAAIPLTLTNVPLGSTQNVTSNCYGGLKFC